MYNIIKKGNYLPNKNKVFEGGYKMSNNKDLKIQLEYFKDEMAEAYENNDFWEYLANLDIYNIDFTVTSCNQVLKYKSVCIMVACGGPNIYIDTGNGAVIGAWGGDREKIYLDNNIINEINNYFEDYYDNFK